MIKAAREVIKQSTHTAVEAALEVGDLIKRVNATQAESGVIIPVVNSAAVWSNLVAIQRLLFD